MLGISALATGAEKKTRLASESAGPDGAVIIEIPAAHARAMLDTYPEFATAIAQERERRATPAKKVWGREKSEFGGWI